MQALQKAAKEREGAANSQPGTASSSVDLRLEPIEFEAHPKSGAGLSSATRSAGPTPAQAAAVLKASAGGAGFMTWLEIHRKTVFGGVIAVAVVGYGVYAYFSINHPSLFRRTPPPAAQIALPASPPAPTLTTSPEPSRSLLSATSSMSSEPVPETSAVAQRRIDRAKDAAESRPRANREAPASAIPSAPRGVKDSIVVKQGGAVPTVHPTLSDAYEALRTGRTEEAKRLYDTLLRIEPLNVDGLLGRAAVAHQQGDGELTSRYLLRVLEIDPSNATAQAGLLSLFGKADPQSAESRLKHLISRDPSPFLYFTLGNLYADQSQWAPAQAAFFQAHHLQPDNPDYLFNLAVSLEHLSQPRLALGFYRQALDLARASGRANFNTSAVEERIGRLASSGE